MVKQGDVYTHGVKFTQADVVKFAEVTGDFNPIHIDAEYAAKTVFKKPIVHGFLSGAVFSKVFGTLFPGEGTIYLSQEMKFLAPIFVEEQYEARFEVMEVNTEKHIGIINCSLVNSEGAPCITGVAKLKHNTQFV
ncbi:MAG TPA: MaoC family dehydratase [Tenuifilaceae bacterium]|nr:MAG: MaoC family dehydratase [Bacteroidales bacterium]HOZ13640.1 MaoC family dehydratase [Tenuifilaceae bacterium]HPI43617.1 MaoC family dehydratase [Tenuifilaceae bacterium]HPN22477.1 MaoC family dehydratase [Tenuifilaceae bacterium]HPV55679.1 MaoC family dehydratase [Tenuifilaceae bacterium]